MCILVSGENRIDDIDKVSRSNRWHSKVRQNWRRQGFPGSNLFLQAYAYNQMHICYFSTHTSPYPSAAASIRAMTMHTMVAAAALALHLFAVSATRASAQSSS